jgi:hypothetical protein
MTNSGGSSAGSGVVASAHKLPPGVEKRLRELWTKLHGFNVSGDWLAQDEVLSKVYTGLQW